MKRIDATLIYPGLYQGGWPPPGHALANAGFKTLVLCAREFQPPTAVPDVLDMVVGFREPSPYPGVKVIYAPNDDNPYEMPEREDVEVALQAARQVVESLRAGNKTLVTCWMGVNRSGLVSALSLHLLLGVSGTRAIQMVKKARRPSLRNGAFVQILSRLRAVPQEG